MSQKYALICSCGSTVPVEVRHAGGTLTCAACSNTVDVPKLREIRQLEPIVEQGGKRRSSGWSGLQGVLFSFGFLILTIAGGGAYYTYQYRAFYDDIKRPDPQEIKFTYDMNKISLLDSWKAWQEFKSVQIATRREPAYVYARKEVERLDLLLKVFGVVATVGLVCMALSFVLRPRPAT